MLLTIAVVVIILCLLGLFTGYTISNFIHILSHCHYRRDGQSHSGRDAHFDANGLPRIKVWGSKTFCNDLAIVARYGDFTPNGVKIKNTKIQIDKLFQSKNMKHFVSRLNM